MRNKMGSGKAQVCFGVGHGFAWNYFFRFFKIPAPSMDE